MIRWCFLCRGILSLPYIFFALILPISTFGLRALLLIFNGAMFFRGSLCFFLAILSGKYHWSQKASFERLGFLKITIINSDILWWLRYQQLSSLVICLFMMIGGRMVFTKYSSEYHRALLWYSRFSLRGLDCFIYSFVGLSSRGISGRLRILR